MFLDLWKEERSRRERIYEAILQAWLLYPKRYKTHVLDWLYTS